MSVVYFKQDDALSLLPKGKVSRARYVVLCKNTSCTNEDRYDSGYCGVCDLLLNQGKGTRR